LVEPKAVAMAVVKVACWAELWAGKTAAWSAVTTVVQKAASSAVQTVDQSDHLSAGQKVAQRVATKADQKAAW